MPFKSQAQRRWMYANHPAMARRWQKHTPKGKDLPEKLHKSAAFYFHHMITGFEKVANKLPDTSYRKMTNILKEELKYIPQGPEALVRRQTSVKAGTKGGLYKRSSFGIPEWLAGNKLIKCAQEVPPKVEPEKIKTQTAAPDTSAVQIARASIDSSRAVTRRKWAGIKKADPTVAALGQVVSKITGKTPEESLRQAGFERLAVEKVMQSKKFPTLPQEYQKNIKKVHGKMVSGEGLVDKIITGKKSAKWLIPKLMWDYPRSRGTIQYMKQQFPGTRFIGKELQQEFRPVKPAAVPAVQ